MTTLIAVYTSDGCIGRCDAKCYNAKDAPCDCVCGGANHGAGIARAIKYTRDNLTDMLRVYNNEHPDVQIEAVEAVLL